MSRFTRELRVIPKAAWIVGWFAYACFTVPLFFFVTPTDPEMGKWPRWGQALLIYGIFLLLVAGVALIGYIYGDAKRRQMRYVLWTLTGDLHSLCDRDNLVLHSPRPSTEAVSRLRECRKGRISVLSARRHFSAANVPAMR